MSAFLQLAPMQGLTEYIFMNAHQQIFGGFSEMMTPYLSANGKSPIKIQTLQKQFDLFANEISIVPQLLSNDADGFVYYANLLYDLGYKKVNWNLGCPFPTVTKKIRGAGLLQYPEKIASLLDEICSQLKPKLSVKIRLGMESNEDILTLIPILNKYPIHELIIHPRTAIQKYEGLVDKQTFGEIYSQFKMPVIYNGDILKKEDMESLNQRFINLKGFMIGRGAFINPFLPNQINGIDYSNTEKVELFKKFYFNIHNEYMETTIYTSSFLGKMKEMWSYFSQAFENGSSIHANLKTVNDIPSFEDAVLKIFSTGKLLI
ncbi:MAG: tRNA-dihydrouridine synthase family protein [Salinivirgaceae bacterium]|nr:tRNA-dihydrouridine synthase family protein [Salinivirgaceae bacterium]